MKKAICVLVILVASLVYVGFSYAGEKEELVWEVKYRTELSKTLQVQFTENQNALKAAVAKLRALNDADKKEIKKENKDGR